MWRIRRGSTILPLLVLLAPGCAGDGTDAPEAGLPTVVASIFPVGDLVQSIAGEGVRVEVVLPPGASPATFDVTPRQLRDLREAGLFVMIGGGLDEWTSRLPEASGGVPTVVRLSDGIDLLEEEEGPEEVGDEAGHDHGSGNPHIWLDPVLVRDRLVPALLDALEAAFPEEAGAMRERAALLVDSLTALDLEIREILRGVEGGAFIATHAAWTYFAGRYGLVEAGVVHAHPGQEPSSRELAHLLELARTNRIRCLFIEPQLGEVAARALATELSLPTCLLDPLGDPSLPERNGYLPLLAFNARQFAAGLGAREP